MKVNKIGWQHINILLISMLSTFYQDKILIDDCDY